MKRLIVCCDGTWQDVGKTFPTNVAKIAAAVKPVDDNCIHQCVYYSPGVGTNGLWSKIVGGGFGKGIDFNIKDAYRFLCLNYQAGDEIYLFGFSRGAYTVRSLVGLIYNSGLLKAEHIDKIEKFGDQIGAYDLYRSRKKEHKPGSDESLYFRKKYCVHVESCKGKNEGRVPITLLACWDTVGSLGLPPIGLLNPKMYFPQWLIHCFPGRYRFHDTRLSSIVLNAIHAVAIDEQRRVFNVTLMSKDHEKKDPNGNVLAVTNKPQQLQQTWFPGDHGSVGGGNPKLQGLSDATLMWMIAQVKALNLPIIFDNSRIPFAPESTALDPTLRFNYFDLLNYTGKKWRTLNKDAVFETDIHDSAKYRWHTLQTYRPKTIAKKFLTLLDNWSPEKNK